jgi:hypothetical protein
MRTAILLNLSFSKEEPLSGPEQLQRASHSVGSVRVAFFPYIPDAISGHVFAILKPLAQGRNYFPWRKQKALNIRIIELQVLEHQQTTSANKTEASSTTTYNEMAVFLPQSSSSYISPLSMDKFATLVYVPPLNTLPQKKKKH